MKKLTFQLVDVEREEEIGMEAVMNDPRALTIKDWRNEYHAKAWLGTLDAYVEIVTNMETDNICNCDNVDQKIGAIINLKNRLIAIKKDMIETGRVIQYMKDNPYIEIAIRNQNCK